MKNKKSINFKPKNATKKLIKDLQDRAQYVLIKRFGLDNEEKRTLESIGQEYGITRERVRQIENFALNAIRKSQSFEEARVLFDELQDIINELGGIVSEDTLLENISSDPITQNHVHLYLVLGDAFERQKEDKHFKARWLVNQDISEKVHKILHDIHDSISEDSLLSEREVIRSILEHKYAEEIPSDYLNEETARRWLTMSKALNANPLGEWGPATSPNIRTRGIRDYAYLVMRKHGAPMHFREVAQAITDTFGKTTHVATCHNELIKDPRFVLVGRGLYGLKEWGYSAGVVRDVIKDILEKEGPLSKEEIVDRVLKERFLKKNTILVNLNNPKYFKKNKNGLYSLV